MKDLHHKLEDMIRAHIADDRNGIGTSHTCLAAQWWVGDALTCRSEGAIGKVTENGPELQLEDPFDLASITKIYTATAIGMQIEEERLTWEHLAAPGLKVIDLLNHTSGLPGYHPFHENLTLRPDAALATRQSRSIRSQIEGLPRDPLRAYAYSDPGYILLGLTLEDAGNRPLEEIIESTAAKAGASSTGFISVHRGDPIRSPAVVTEECRRRGLVQGFVHDENADAIGGAAGHAGLFANARDVACFARAILTSYRGRSGPLSRQTLDFMWDHGHRKGSHVLGWDTPSGKNSSAGRGFSRKATFGHLGFTGTSVWIDVQAGLIAVLLTNRVFPTRKNPRIKQMRVDFHELVSPPD